MIEIRFHGLGGHGAVVASKLLAEAAGRSGNQSQAFASYGALRRGGKVESYVRISSTPVRPHCKLYEPDWLVLMDESIAEDPTALSGLKENGSVLINSSRMAKTFSALERFKVYTVDAYDIAGQMGLILPGGMPVINTTILGALVGLLDMVDMEDLKEVILAGTPKAEKNVQCALQGQKYTFQGIEDRKSQVTNVTDQEAASFSGGKYPVYDMEKAKKCNRCQICYMVCPSLAIRFEVEPFTLYVDQGICTGCGICIEECPRGVISWGGGKHD